MKKSFKIILTVTVSLAALVVLLLAILLAIFKLETANMSPLETGKAADGVYAVKDDFVNLYLIKGKKNYIAVDAGASLESVEEQLKKININPEDVEAVFLTHSDGDHVSAAPLFKKAKIYMPEGEEEIISGKTKRFLFFANSINFKYILIKSGITMNIDGIQVSTIAAPGHTPGSMCYLIKGIYLFTGDNLSLKEGRAEIFNKFFNMNSGLQEETLKKLSSLDGIKYIFTAHHGYTSDFSKAFEKWK